MNRTQRKIIVDADACPRSCLQVIREAAQRFDRQMVTAASYNHQIDSDCHITVGPERDAADFAVVNQAAAGDVVVTQDWGLAALVVAKGAAAVSPHGRVFAAEEMTQILEERALKARYRRSGGRTRGPRRRTSGDDANFRSALFRLLERPNVSPKTL